MLPIIASVNTFNFQTPLVNTTTPGTNTVHVPYDNVAPSASDAQVDNNTQGNNTVILPPEQAASYDNTASTQENNATVSAQLQASTASNAGVQSAFVAQLAAQDDSPETHVILVQYEKIIANGNVKYQPAQLGLKPQAAPSSVFGRILQGEKAAAPITPTPQPNITATQQSSEATPARPLVRSTKTTTSGSDTTDTTPASNDNTSAPIPTPAPAVAATPIPITVTNAYTATAARVAIFTPPVVQSSTSAPSKEFA